MKRESNEDGLIPRAFFALAFENELEYHYLYEHINSSDDQATSDINLVGFLICASRVQLRTTGVDQRSNKYIYVRQMTARLFCYYLLGGDTVALSGLYARLCHGLCPLLRVLAKICYPEIVSIANKYNIRCLDVFVGQVRRYITLHYIEII